MGLKILHSADWHLDSPFGSVGEADRAFLRQESRRIPSLIAQLCRREHCDLMLLSGDLFDGAYTAESLTELREALKYAGVPVLIAPGNHDPLGPDSPWEREKFPENVHIFPAGISHVDFPELDARVYGAGYTGMDCPPLLEGFHAEPGSRYRIGVFHGDAVAPNSPCCPITGTQVRESGLSYLALGHIHRADGFRAGQTLCAWPGCPMGRGWDETGEKGVLLVTLGEDAGVRPVSLGLPGFFSQKVPIGDDPIRAAEALLPPGGQDSFYRLTLTGRGNVDMDALKRHFSRYPRLEFLDRTAPAPDLAALSGTETLSGVLFGKLLALSREPEMKETALLAAQITADILDGREVELP